MRLINHENVEELIREVFLVPQEIDRLPYGPIRANRNDFGLHPPTGGIFGKLQTLLDILTLLGRDFPQHVGDFFLLQVFEYLHGFVGLHLGNRRGHFLWRKNIRQFPTESFIQLKKQVGIQVDPQDAQQTPTLRSGKKGNGIGKVRVVHVFHASPDISFRCVFKGFHESRHQIGVHSRLLGLYPMDAILLGKLLLKLLFHEENAEATSTGKEVC